MTQLGLPLRGSRRGGTGLLAVALGRRFECAGVVYQMDSQISQASFLHCEPSAESIAPGLQPG
jgi:hypothetical protein